MGSQPSKPAAHVGQGLLRNAYRGYYIREAIEFSSTDGRDWMMPECGSVAFK